jgi:hypothetical protein
VELDAQRVGVEEFHNFRGEHYASERGDDFWGAAPSIGQGNAFDLRSKQRSNK